MEMYQPTFTHLFAQLGLPFNNADDIQGFIVSHGPLGAGLALSDAPFWSAEQARFLREQIANDADWALVIDSLDASLRQ